MQHKYQALCLGPSRSPSGVGGMKGDRQHCNVPPGEKEMNNNATLSPYGDIDGLKTLELDRFQTVGVVSYESDSSSTKC